MFGVKGKTHVCNLCRLGVCLTPDFESQRETYVARMKEAGALHWFYVLTSDTTARSMTVWPDQATAHKALTMARDEAAAQNNQTITAVCEGVVLSGF